MKKRMNKIEGCYSCYGGILVTQCSVWDIVDDREEKQIKKIIKRISKRNKQLTTVKVTISLEMEENKK